MSIVECDFPGLVDADLMLDLLCLGGAIRVSQTAKNSVTVWITHKDKPGVPWGEYQKVQMSVDQARSLMLMLAKAIANSEARQ